LNTIAVFLRFLQLLPFFLACAGLAGQVAWQTYTVGDGSITRTVCPSDYQLYPRNERNTGYVQLTGTLAGEKQIRIIVERHSFNGAKTKVYDRSYKLKDGRFEITIPIYAQLAEYDFFYVAGRRGVVTRIASHVVCGDVYLISGQSNINTFDLTHEELIHLNSSFGGGYAGVRGSAYHRYCIGFGDETPFTERRKWHRTSVVVGPYKHVGAPALVFQHELVRRHGIPVCVISGAVGATDITNNHLPAPGEYFFNPLTYTIQPPGTNPSPVHQYRLFTRLNTNVYAAGLENHIKGIVWLQGDGGAFNKEIGYIEEFRKLHTLWKKFFPGLKRTYLIQVHSWVMHEDDFRRMSEEQRTVPKFIPDVTVLSTNGIGFHRTESGHEVHFSAQGYINLGMRIAGALGRDFYGKGGIEVLPPDIAGASRKGNEVRLYFTQVLSPKLSDHLDSILRVIKFNTGFNIKTSPVIKEHRLIFNVADTNISSVSYAGYIPSEFGVDPSYIEPDYPCYLRNEKGIAALSFHNIPVVAFDPNSQLEHVPAHDNAVIASEIKIYPNPSTGLLFVTGEHLTMVTISDLSGRVLFSYSGIMPDELEVQTHFLRAGLYYFRAHSEKHGWVTKKLIKE
jgi:hypothetical protein